jgi:hypothetical protein
LLNELSSLALPVASLDFQPHHPYLIKKVARRKQICKGAPTSDGGQTNHPKNHHSSLFSATGLGVGFSAAGLGE